MSSTSIQRAVIEHATAEQWRAQIERDLKGASFERRLVHRTAEGIDIQPLYVDTGDSASADVAGFPGTHSRTRGESLTGNQGGWEILSVVDHPDHDTAIQRAREALANGASGILFGAASAACSPSFWPALFRTIDPRSTILSLPTSTVGHQPVEAILQASVAASSRDDELCLYAGLDPLGHLATTGSLATSCWAQVAQLLDTSWTASAHSRCLRIDDRSYHYAGASEAQSIAFTIAAAIDTLRALEAQGVAPTHSARQLEFMVQLDCEFFMSIAKLRALRCLWSVVREQCGLQTPLRIHTRTSPRVLSQRDPWVNILRNTTTCFAGAVAGANAISTESFDCRLGLPSAEGQRLACTTQLVLGLESHLDKVIDPAGGSYFIDKLTQELAAKAWAITQAIEARGGMQKALLSGWIADQIDPVRDERNRAIQRRKKPITGVSEFPNLEEQVPERPQRPAPSEVEEHDPSGYWRVPRLPQYHFADPFEALRARSDRWLTEHGHRPHVDLLLLGAIANHTGRSTFVQNLVQAGGLVPKLSPPLLDHASALAYATTCTDNPIILCGSNDDVTTLARPLARALTPAQQTRLWIAGQPQPDMQSYHDAGIHFVVKLGDNMAEQLELLWTLVEGK